MTVSWKPERLSAVHGLLAALGPRWIEQAGWRVVDSFTEPADEARRVREGVGLEDMSALGKIDLKGADTDPRVLDPIRPDVVSTLRFKPGHLLVLTGPGKERRAIETLNGLTHQCLHVTDVTSGYSAFSLAGPRAAELLAGVTSLDLREAGFANGSCQMAPLARVHAAVERADIEGLPRYRLLVSRDVGEYLWDVLWRAGAPLGLVPFGAAAGELLEGTR